MSGEALVFRDVWKRYGNIEALRGASFRVPRGVLAGLVGPNGAGKTTCFRLALGFVSRDSGRVEVLGVDPLVEERVRLRIGYLPEKPVYPVDVTVEAFLEHAARVRGVDVGEARRLVVELGLGDRLGSLVGSLSRGMLQRLGLVHALLGDPELLLLDEPTSNLDPVARIEVLGLVKSIASERGATVIVSTHILPELEKIADYLILVNRGVVIAEGGAAEVASRLKASIYLEAEAMDERTARLAASKLIVLEEVDAVEISGRLLRVRCKGCREAEAVLEELRARGIVAGYRRVGGDLLEVYKRLVGGDAGGG